MNLQQLPPWRVLLPLTAWLGLLAVLPWWSGLSLLCALVAALLLLGARLDDEHAATLRRALRWGLPGVLFALQRALGGDAVAWGAALLGALAGYMLIVALELWLDRDSARPKAAAGTTTVLISGPVDPPPPAAASEWPARVMVSAIGPPAEIITLQPPQWQAGDAALPDPWGDQTQYQDGGYRFIGKRRVDGVEPRACFSPDGRWFAAELARSRGILLWDRRGDRTHRLRGWQLAGWYREQPWLQRDVDAAPRPLAHVLGEDPDSGETPVA